METIWRSYRAVCFNSSSSIAYTYLLLQKTHSRGADTASEFFVKSDIVALSALVPNAAAVRSLDVARVGYRGATYLDRCGNDVAIVCANNLQFCINIFLHNFSVLKVTHCSPNSPPKVGGVAVRPREYYQSQIALNVPFCPLRRKPRRHGG